MRKPPPAAPPQGPCSPDGGWWRRRLLAKTPVYKKQRTFRTERASAMARAKLRSGVSGWPGTLSIVEYPTAADADDGTVGSVLVDGQHRLGAFTLLARKVKGDGAKPISGMEEMLVEVGAQTATNS
mgnify:FL=1